MGKILGLFVLAVLIVVYFFLFNLFNAMSFQINSPAALDGSVASSTYEKVGVGDQVEVKVFRDGFFWDVETISYEHYKNSKVYFAGIIPLPLVRNNFSFFWIHAVVGALFFIAFLGIIFSNERRYYDEASY